jgi:hypothetical protein
VPDRSVANHQHARWKTSVAPPEHRANRRTFAEDGFFRLQLDVVMVTAVTGTVTNTALQF